MPGCKIASGVLVLSALATWSASGNAQPPSLHSDTEGEPARAGYYVLDWGGSGGGTFELRERLGSTPTKLLYRGPDTARLISGRTNGDYRYQVRRIGETDWSQPVSVRVEHHPLSRAFGFFLVGAAVFIATLILVVRGARNG